MPEASAPKTKYFEACLGRAHGIPIEGGDHVEREALQLEADIERDQIVGRDHHHHAGSGQHDEHGELEARDALGAVASGRAPAAPREAEPISTTTFMKAPKPSVMNMPLRATWRATLNFSTSPISDHQRPADQPRHQRRAALLGEHPAPSATANARRALANISGSAGGRKAGGDGDGRHLCSSRPSNNRLASWAGCGDGAAGSPPRAAGLQSPAPGEGSLHRLQEQVGINPHPQAPPRSSAQTPGSRQCRSTILRTSSRVILSKMMRR